MSVHTGNSFFSLKKEVSSMMSSACNSRMSTQQSFKGDIKFGKVVIVGVDEDYADLELETLDGEKMEGAKKRKASAKSTKSDCKKRQKKNVNRKQNKCK
jgi:hypothetical protein